MRRQGRRIETKERPEHSLQQKLGVIAEVTMTQARHEPRSSSQ